MAAGGSSNAPVETAAKQQVPLDRIVVIGKGLPPGRSFGRRRVVPSIANDNKATARKRPAILRQAFFLAILAAALLLAVSGCGSADVRNQVEQTRKQVEQRVTHAEREFQGQGPVGQQLDEDDRGGDERRGGRPVQVGDAQRVGDRGPVAPQPVAGLLPDGGQVPDAELELDQAQRPRSAGRELPEAVACPPEPVDRQRRPGRCQRAEEREVADQPVAGVAHQPVAVLERHDADPHQHAAHAGRTRRVSLVARTTAKVYGSRLGDVRDFVAETGADHLIEGTVRAKGELTQVVLWLANGQTGRTQLLTKTASASAEQLSELAAQSVLQNLFPEKE